MLIESRYTALVLVMLCQQTGGVYQGSIRISTRWENLSKLRILCFSLATQQIRKKNFGLSFNNLRAFHISHAWLFSLVCKRCHSSQLIWKKNTCGLDLWYFSWHITACFSRTTQEEIPATHATSHSSLRSPTILTHWIPLWCTFCSRLMVNCLQIFILF